MERTLEGGEQARRQRGLSALILVCALAFPALGAYAAYRSPRVYCSWHSRAPRIQDLGESFCQGPESGARLNATAAGSDTSSYLLYAQHVLESHDFVYWAANIWPPLHPLLIALDLKLFGDAHYTRDMGVLGAVAWALALLLWFNAIRSLGPACVLSGLLLFLPTFESWAFGVGTLTSESLSLAFLIGTLGAFGIAVRKRKLRAFIATGLLMAAGCYVRGFYSSLWEMVLFGVACCMVLGGLFRFIEARGRQQVQPQTDWRARFLREEWTSPYGRVLALSLLLLVLVELGTAPWKRRMVTAANTYAMTYSAHLAFENSMWSPEVPSWLVTGNLPCRIDPAVCKAINLSPELKSYENKKRLAFFTLVTRPGPWLAGKFRAIGDLWFGEPLAQADPFQIFENVLYLGMFLGGVGTLVAWGRRRPAGSEGRALAVTLLLATLFVLLAHTVVLILIHYEYRFALPLKLYAFCLPFLAGALARSTSPARVPAATVAPSVPGLPAFPLGSLNRELLK